MADVKTLQERLTKGQMALLLVMALEALEDAGGDEKLKEVLEKAMDLEAQEAELIAFEQEARL